ncbi:DUF410-domain-containing protein [Ascodesmis nigricans]|uniref:DUF410-domain-containing protein n=1 Tax=Ascodesmis nigricans TaxID=341454 RepID=A0A4S2N478_9PEZI|nr:DUF410-domain-containing protein [Ascodesmis nigricans]
MPSQNIEKTRARMQLRIQEGQYYEAHQQLRVVSQRYVKAKNYDAAIDILTSGANALFKAGQSASAGDICLLILDVYRTASKKPDQDSKARIIELLSQLPSTEPIRKRFITESIAWTSKFGIYPAGDPFLHHYIGTLLVSEHDYYEAERHLLLGTPASASTLATALFNWYQHDSPHTAALYISRAVFPYLLLGNLRDAHTALKIFTEKLVEKAEKTGLVVQTIEDVKYGTVKVFPSLPGVNFLTLLVLSAAPGGREVWQFLEGHYQTVLREAPWWKEALEQIGESYFDVKIRRQTNILDMMGSLFGGPGPQQQAIGGPGGHDLD